MHRIIDSIPLVRRYIRHIYLRLNNVKADNAPVFVWNWPIIHNHGTFKLGANCLFKAIRVPQWFLVEQGAQLLIGNNVYINEGVKIVASHKVEIGDYCKIANFVTIYDTDFHELCDSVPIKTAPIFIGRNVWICNNVSILPGVTIGDHSVIGAGAVVTKDIPPKSIAVGNPAKVIKILDVPEDWIRK